MRRLTAALVCTAMLGVGAVAQALPVPTSPQDASVLEQWVNPQARIEASGVDFSLQQLGDPDGELGVPTSATLDVHTNRSDLSVVVMRADAVGTVADARAALAADTSDYPVASAPQPVQSNDGHVNVRLSAEELRIAAPGTYPLLFALQSNGEIVATERTLIRVQPTAAESAATGEGVTEDSAAGDGSASSDKTPLTLVWPLSARTHKVAGETGTAPEQAPLVLANDELAAEIVPGGRLDVLLDAYLAALDDPLMAQASCLAIDPALLDTVDRMSRGYTISATRPSPVAQKLRLRDSWNGDDTTPKGEIGSAVPVAGQWVAKVRSAAERGCTVTLPWANSDLGAINRTGSTEMMHNAISEGASTVQRILGTQLSATVVIPGNGYINPSTAPALALATQDAQADEDHNEIADLPALPTQPANPDMAPQPSAAVGQFGEDTQPEAVPVPPVSTDAAIAATDAAAATDTAIAATDAAAAANADAAADTSSAAEMPQPGMDSADAALDNPQLPTPENHIATPTPGEPVSVLVADNTVQGAAFATLADGVTAVSYPASLSAVLAELGPDPVTVPYSNPATRYDYSVDSQYARTLTAQAAIELQAATGQPLLLLPPTELVSGSLLTAASQLLHSGTATPLPLPQALQPGEQPVLDLRGSQFGAPFANPAEVTDTEILRGTQQATYIGDIAGLMRNDPQIALTKYGFVEPLFEDLVRAYSLNGRQSLSTYMETVGEADTILHDNRNMLQQLRASVSLLPPGNVYTRASSSSPLLMVARNGLPLPVEAKLEYTGPAGVIIHVPASLVIPAKGSITTSMTADLPKRGQTTLGMWLATSDGAAISTPIEISVKTRSGMFGAPLIAAGVLLVFVLRILVVRRRRAQRRTARKHDAPRGRRSPPGRAVDQVNRPTH